MRKTLFRPVCGAVALAAVLAGAALAALAAQKPDQPREIKLPAFLDAKPLKPAANDDELRKLLKERYNVALKEVTWYNDALHTGQLSHPDLEGPFRRLVKAQLELCAGPKEEVAVLKKYVEFLQDIEKLTNLTWQAGRIPDSELLQVQYLHLDAQIQLLKAQRRAQADSK